MVTITGYCDEANTQDDQTTIYTYDKLGNVTCITYPDDASIEYAYNDRGGVWKRTDQRDLVTYYVYNAAGGLLTKTNDPNAGGDLAIVSDPNVYDPNAVYWAETFTYDGLGRPLTAAKVVDGNAISGSVFVYNALGMLTSEAQTLFGGTPRTVNYGYDQFGYRTSTAYPDGSTTITRTNAWNGQIDTLRRGQVELVSYDYLGSRTARRSYHTTTLVQADTTYDGLGRITDITAGSLVDFHYDYVADENNIWKKRFDHRSGDPYNEYTYDDIDRVTGITYLDSDTESFVMDDLGNRAGNQTLRDDGTVNFAIDTETNRYTSIDSASLDYDDAGNLTTDKDGYVYTYDYENRIVKIIDDEENLIAQFDYDTLGRRIRVYDAIADTTTLYYYSDNWQVLAEYDSSNNQQAYYVYGNYIDETMLMHRDSADKFYLHDHLYSPVALVNTSGAVVERYEYDAYGKVTVWDSTYTNSYLSSQFGNPYLFTGRRLDSLDWSSGTSEYDLILMYYRHRTYNSEIGRFLQQDPLGIDPVESVYNSFSVHRQYTDGLNIYEYVESNPVINTDKYGMISDSECCKTAAEAGWYGEKSKTYNQDGTYNIIYGRLICCEGRKVSCYYRKYQDEPFPPDVDDLGQVDWFIDTIKWECGLIHENTHKKHTQACDECGIYPAYDLPGLDTDLAECSAYKQQYNCLKNAESRCENTKDPERCKEGIKKEKERVENRYNRCKSRLQ